VELQTVRTILPDIFTWESVHIRALLETFRSREGARLLGISLLREKRLIFFHILQGSGHILMQLTRIEAS
jgi:hypothetical protein